MSRRPAVVLLVALFWLAAGVANAATTTIDFEDLWPGYESTDRLPAGYAGFSWTNARWITKNYSTPSGYHNTIEGNVGIFTGWSSALTMDGDTFSIASLKLGAAWRSALAVHLRGYRGGVEVENQTVSVSDAGSVFEVGFPDIDRLVVEPSPIGYGYQVVIDNIVLGEPEPPPSEIIADAGDDQTVEQESSLGTEVTLDGSGSSSGPDVTVWEDTVTNFSYWGYYYGDWFYWYHAQDPLTTPIISRTLTVTVYYGGGYPGNTRLAVYGTDGVWHELGDQGTQTGTATYTVSLDPAWGPLGRFYALVPEWGFLQSATLTVVHEGGGGAVSKTVTIPVSEDEAVVALYPDSNFQSNSYLYVGMYGYQDGQQFIFPCRSYLKFDLSSIPAGAETIGASLHAFLLGKYPYDVDIAAYSAPCEWSPETITWNNAPGTTGGPHDTVSPPIAYNNWYDWDVTAPVVAEHAGNGEATLVLRDAVEGEYPYYARTLKSFAESEHSENGAYLSVTYLTGGGGGGGEATYEWYEGEELLGTGETLDVTLNLGVHTITLVVSDGVSSATDEVIITVVDTTPPVLVMPDDITELEQATSAGTTVEFEVTATDICDPALDIACDPESGSVFPLGTTTVNCTAMDESGNVTEDSFTITVVDTTPPEADLSILQSTLWPPNHKMHLCATLTGVADVCDVAPEVFVTVTSNEPISGKGDGNTDYDWEIVRNGDVWEVWLRAERAGPSDGRIYTITAIVTDDSGNSTTNSATVTVDHDQGNGGGGGKGKK